MSDTILESLRGRPHLTPSEVAALVNLPQWGPSKRVTQIYGFSRSEVFRHLKAGHFRSALFKKPGASPRGTKAVRLIDLKSVEEFILRHVDTPAKAP